MTNTAGIWGVGAVVSIALNLGAAMGLMAAMQPNPIADQPVPESRLDVEAHAVTRSDASEQTPQSQTAAEGAATGAKLGNREIAQSVAQPKPALLQKSQAQTPSPRAAPALPPTVSELASQLPSSARTSAEPLIAKMASALEPAVSTTKPVPAAAPDVMPVSIPTTPTSPQRPKPTALAPSAPPSLASLPQPADSTPAPRQVPEVTKSTAMLAFPSAGSVDPVSFAAFQSFMQPDAAAGTDVRDSLGAVLSLPCARMQVSFDPETTTLNLTGHVPDPSQRGPVLDALQAQMGTDIAVTENLLVLPAPQCGALTGIADVGLPQSTDQITNALIVGADTHARAFRYVAGDPLVMSLTAPDYPAYVYVDYFDADGNVIHLSPNDRTPLQAVEPKSALQIGAESASDTELFVTIGPPYGQEIAAAFAASAPLYDGTRPLVEPAGPYLAWLKERVAQKRTQHADFKGEWVYFFVTTAAR
jgi:hypothetical protein